MFVKLNGLYFIDLMCGPELALFYAKLGMIAATGTVLLRHGLRGVEFS
jgi:hypothetical protein